MEYDLQVGHKITFMCGADQDRAGFLIKEFNPDAMICDALTVTNYRLKDTHPGKMVCLNHGRILEGGFSCTSKSSLNNNRTDHRHCLSDPKPTAATALTWKDLSSVIVHGKYECVFLENVVELMGGAAEDSDVKVILSELETYGFQCEIFIVQADTFGSMTSKKRLFIIGYSGSKPSALRKSATIRTILDTMKHETSYHAISDFSRRASASHWTQEKKGVEFLLR